MLERLGQRIIKISIRNVTWTLPVLDKIYASTPWSIIDPAQLVEDSPLT